MYKRIVGIYKITNTINSKVYIGQSHNILYRWYSYKNSSKCHNEHLKRSIIKYGIDNFTFEIIKEFSSYDQKLLDFYEETYI